MLIADDTATAHVEMDDKGIVLAWPPGATRLFGYATGEAVGASLGELIIPVRMRAAHENGLRRFRERGEASLLGTRFDVPALHRDGRELRIELQVTRADDRFHVAMRELDRPAPINGELYLQAQAAQQRERAETARMTALIEALNVGVLLQDEHRRVVVTNSAFVEMFALGLPPERIRGSSPRGGSFAHLLADPDESQRRVDEAVRRGRPVTGDEVRLGDGRVLERDYVPVTLDGTTLGHLWVFRDVTAQATIRRGLEERNRLLTDLSELKTEFVRVASHELRTPLTSIATFAGMLELGDDVVALDPGDRQAALTAIRRNAERMQLVVTDLLLLTQLEAAETPLDLVPVDIAQLVREFTDDVHARLDVHPGPPVRGDEHLLRQLFRTAVSVVAAATEAETAITVSAEADHRRWTVVVGTATSAPVSAERLLSVRIPHPDQPGEHRTGALALMLARAIAARHQGEMVTSVERPGVTVTVHLPA